MPILVFLISFGISVAFGVFSGLYSGVLPTLVVALILSGAFLLMGASGSEKEKRKDRIRQENYRKEQEHIRKGKSDLPRGH